MHRRDRKVCVTDADELARERLAGLDQAAGETIACKLVSIGYAHLAVVPMHEALSAMSIEELEPLFS